MGWSTVEWPPKNGTNIKPTPKLRKKLKKLIIICLTLIFLFAGALGVGVLSKDNQLSLVIVKEKTESVQKDIHNYYKVLLSNLVKVEENK